MARMIPEHPTEDTESRAEIRLFEHLRDETDDDLIVFHHVAWLIPGASGRPEQGEADFVLAHPKHGLLVLEAKGGTISYDAVQGQWWTRGRSGDARIRDPFHQARKNSHSLRRLLERGHRVSDNRFFASYAVAWPNTRVRTARLKPDAPREVIVDGDDLRQLEARLRQVFNYWAEREKGPGLATGDLEHIERTLANSFEVSAPLSLEMAEEARELLQLTKQQYYILDMLDRHPRAAIAGCAGSGKTFLAAEKARRLAQQGFRVLVLCFNRLLAEHLRRGLADADGVDAKSYDVFAARSSSRPGSICRQRKKLRASTGVGSARSLPKMSKASQVVGTGPSSSTRHRTSTRTGGCRFRFSSKTRMRHPYTSSSMTTNGSFR